MESIKYCKHLGAYCIFKQKKYSCKGSEECQDIQNTMGIEIKRKSLENKTS